MASTSTNDKTLFFCAGMLRVAFYWDLMDDPCLGFLVPSVWAVLWTSAVDSLIPGVLYSSSMLYSQGANLLDWTYSSADFMPSSSQPRLTVCSHDRTVISATVTLRQCPLRWPDLTGYFGRSDLASTSAAAWSSPNGVCSPCFSVQRHRLSYLRASLRGCARERRIIWR